jgi:GNAT superfamily N-acetyltransferase
VSTRRKPRRKAGGRVPTATARRVGRSELLHGWVGPHGYRVRFARPGEGSAVGELLERAEVEFDAQMIEEIDGTAMGTSLRLGVEFGKKAMLRAVAANSVHLADRDATLAAQATVLVAAQRDNEQVDGVLALVPPGVVLRQCLERGLSYGEALAALMAIVKVAALAVAPAARGVGLASALLDHGLQLYRQAGFYLVFGSFHDHLGLEPFYRRQGFTVLPLRQGLPLEVELGPRYGITPGPGERLFYRRPLSPPV